MPIPFLKTGYLIRLLLLIGSLVGCKTINEEESSPYSLPMGYSLENHQLVRLDEELTEISGIAWNKNSLLAIEDESSVIFELEPLTGKILQKEKFEKNRDVEDILVNGTDAWVLRSNGNLYQISHFLTDSASTSIFEFPIRESRDMEAFVLSPDKTSIYIFCKVCEWDESPDKSSVFRFSLESLTFEEIPFKTLHHSQIESILPENREEIKLQPSAAAYHPLTGDLFLISSTDKWLMVLDQEWNPKSIHFLDPKYFWQAEGMTFDEVGNLYISNEAGIKSANWLFFPYAT